MNTVGETKRFVALLQHDSDVAAYASFLTPMEQSANGLIQSPALHLTLFILLRTLSAKVNQLLILKFKLQL